MHGKCFLDTQIPLDTLRNRHTRAVDVIGGGCDKKRNIKEWGC